MEVTIGNIASVVRNTVDSLKKSTHGYQDLNYSLVTSKSTNSVYVSFSTKLPSGETLTHSIRVSDHHKTRDVQYKGKVVVLYKNTRADKLKRSIRNTIEDLYITRANIVVGGRQYVHSNKI